MPRPERDVACPAMEESQEIEPPAESTSELGLRGWIAAHPVFVKVSLIVAAPLVVGYSAYAVFAISMNVIGEGLGL